MRGGRRERIGGERIGMWRGMGRGRDRSKGYVMREGINEGML